MLNDPPLDDLTDDVTVAADADLVDQIRRKAAGLRDAKVDAPTTVEAPLETPADDDDVTVPAPKQAQSSVRRRSLTSTPSPSEPEPKNRAEVEIAAGAEVAEARAAASRQALTPIARPLEPVLRSPFVDDEVSLIAEQDVDPVEHVWEPPARFETEQQVQKAGSPGLRRIVLLLIAAVVLTAVITALIVLAITGDS